MFEGEITFVGPFTEGKRGGFYRVVVIKTLEDKPRKARVYVNPENRNSGKWEPLLKVGAILKNLFWKDREAGLIDADSPVEEA